MKVICVNAGNQTEDGGFKVAVGSEYTVIDTATGADVGQYHRAYETFYFLKEGPSDQCYWEGLFAQINEETISQKIASKATL